MSDDGMLEAVIRSLERSRIRTRESEITRSAWKMEVACDAGAGTITLVETSAGQPLYRGDGLFLGWSQEQLGLLYLRLQSGNDEPPLEMLQLG